MAGRTLLVKGTYKAIVNGATTCIWSEPWVGIDRLIRAESRPLAAGALNRVCDLLLDDGCSWDVVKLQRVFSDEVCQSICKVEICQGMGEDRWIWNEDPRGWFTVRSCYNLAMREKWKEVNLFPDLFFHVDDLFWKNLWKLPILSRYKVFLWRACLDILPTVEALGCRGIVIGELCPFCEKEREDAFHVLVECPCLQTVWREARFGSCGKSYYGSILEWLVVEGRNWSEERWCLLAVALYQIWQVRNQIKFCHATADFSDFWLRVERVWEEALVANDIGSQNSKALMQTCWSRPKGQFVKLNVDAAISRNGEGSLGGVIRDSEGICVSMFVEQVQHLNDPMLLEAKAIKKGMEVAASLGTEFIEVESDARLVVEMLNSSHMYASRLGVLCREILNLKLLFQVRFSWTPRLCKICESSWVKLYLVGFFSPVHF